MKNGDSSGLAVMKRQTMAAFDFNPFNMRQS